jgi:hypothetical protein
VHFLTGTDVRITPLDGQEEMTTILTLETMQERISDRLVALDLWSIGMDNPVVETFANVLAGVLHRPELLQALIDFFGGEADGDDLVSARNVLAECIKRADAEEDAGRAVLTRWLNTR